MALLLLVGCAARAPTRSPQSELSAAAQALIHIDDRTGNDGDVVLVARAAVDAVHVAQRWGSVLHPVTLRLHPTHDALEVAAHQKDVPWMRGWARFDEVELETPSSWGGHRAPATVRELLRHEMTHVVMYQQVSTRDGWTQVNIPLWFREGMASVTSQQGYRRMTGEQLGEWLRQHPSHDPWMGADALGPDTQPVVYGAAHRAFERLLARISDEGVRKILDGLRQSGEFEGAFTTAAGARPAVFLANFRRELEQASALGDAPGPGVAAVLSAMSPNPTAAFP